MPEERTGTQKEQASSSVRIIDTDSGVIREVCEDKNLRVRIKAESFLETPCDGGVDKGRARDTIERFVKKSNIYRNLCNKNCKNCPLSSSEYSLPVIPVDNFESKFWVIGCMPTKACAMLRVPFGDGNGILLRDIFEKEGVNAYYTYLCNCVLDYYQNAESVITNCMENHLLSQLQIGQPEVIFCLDAPVVKVLQSWSSISLPTVQKSGNIYECRIQGINHPVKICSVPDFTKVTSIKGQAVKQMTMAFESIIKKPLEELQNENFRQIS